MNHPEARALLLNEVRLRMTVKYAEWPPLVGKEILSHVQGATGVDGTITAYPATAATSMDKPISAG